MSPEEALVYYDEIIKKDETAQGAYYGKALLFEEMKRLKRC